MQREKLDTPRFVTKAKKVHNNKYDYSLAVYKTSNHKVKIICPIHNIIEQLPYNHLKGHGCAKCARDQTRGRKAHWCTGNKNSNWKGGVTQLSDNIRHHRKYYEWRNKIKTRDGKSCVICQTKSKRMHVDHIKSLKEILKEYKINTLQDAVNTEILWDINNGRLLCESCHTKTDTFGGYYKGPMHHYYYYCTNIIDGTTTVFKSARKTANFLKVSPETVLRHRKLNYSVINNYELTRSLRV